MAFKFKTKMETKGTLIVDALNLAFRWKHTTKYNTFRFEFQKTVQSLAASYCSEKIILAADWGSSSYRKELYPDYKGDRKEKYKNQTEEEKIAFEEFFEEFEATLDMLKDDFAILRYKNVEADDLAAHLVLHKKQYELDNIWLISSDADWNLLVQKDVNQFSWRTRKEITVDNWPHDVPIKEYISLKCLQGDKGDNIPGIKGIGPKRGAGLIKQYGSAMDIYDAIPIDSKYTYIEALNANPETLLLNYELMDLLTYCDDAVGKENINNIRKKMGDIEW